MPTLSNYVKQASVLLRDVNNLYTSLDNLKLNINAARKQIAKQTACIQILVSGQSSFGASAQPGSAIPGGMVPGSLPGAYAGVTQSTSVNGFQTISGVEKYPYSYANKYVQDANAGVDKIIDVSMVAVSYGGYRPQLNFMPWDNLEAYGRSWSSGNFSYPFLWSANGLGSRGEVWLFPVPDVGPTNSGVASQGEMEWLTACSPKNLYTDDDYEALPDEFTDGVQYFAAFLSLMAGQRYGSAQVMLNHFNDFLGIDSVVVDRGKTDSYYYSSL